MSSYTFTKTVSKPIAFASYLAANYPAEYPATAGVEFDATAVTISIVEALTEAQQVALGALVEAYVDPEFFLQLNHTDSMPGISKQTSSTTPFDVQAAIFPNVTNTADGTVIDAIKTILQISTDDISQFTDLATGSVTIAIYDCTRETAICSVTEDVSSIIASWQTAALASATGAAVAYKSTIFVDLYSKSTDYDCIWIYRASVSDSRFAVTMNGLQTLYYDVL